MNIGIYKWVSPTGRTYVGQSKDLDSRYKWYTNGSIYNSKMTKLKYSFKKYGIENHVFEIIEYCLLEQLNEKEIYWGQYYDTLENGLNCKLGEQNCIFSKSTKNKMSKAKKGTKQTEDQKQKRKTSFKKTWKNKMDNGFKRAYFKQTEEIKNEKSKTRKNKIVNNETRKKISDSLKGRKHSEEHNNNISKARIGKPIHSEESKQKLKEHGKSRDLSKMREMAVKARCKSILQYDSDGNFIKEWSSFSSAEAFYNKRKTDNIGSTIRHFKKTGIQRKAYGFIWKLKT
jgi:group I intron endonuclease